MMKDSKDILKAQSKAVRAYRWKKIKSNKCMWICFVICILLLFACPFICNLHFQSDTYPILNALLTILFNVSIGYFTGFIVYLFITFFPTTKRDVITRDGIYFNLYLVSQAFKSVESKNFPGIGKINRDKYTCQLFNFLVVDANVSTIEADKPLSKKLTVNEKNYAFVLSRLKFACQDISRMITSYGRDMENSDLEALTDIAQLEEDLVNARKGDVFCYDYLYYFINEFVAKGHQRLMYLVYKYKVYKYSDYEAERIKIDYKNGY